MYQEKELFLHLSGKGESVKEAFQRIFQQVQSAVSQQVSNEVVIRIEPQDVNILSAKQERWTERFLGILFPRERTIYHLQVEISVRVGLISTSDIEFTEVTKQRSMIPNLSKVR